MKKWTNNVSLVLLVLVLTGCSFATNREQSIPVYGDTIIDEENIDFTDSVNSKNSSDTQNDQTATNDSNTNTSLRFKEFSLEVDFPNNQSYEMEYEVKSIGTEAKIKDERTNERIIGKDAFAKIQPFLKKLQFTKSTPDADVKKEILSVFKVEENYRKIELEVTFTEGIEKEFTFYP